MAPDQLPQEVHNTVEGFGFEWLTFNEPIQGTYMTDKALFLDFIHPISEDFFEDRWVLDAGCGMGRFLKLGAELGSREIIGVDLSPSVEAAYRNTRALSNAHVVQADILSLPFLRQFDYIFSIGVLHHMQAPQKGFSQLTRHLRDNGRISVWVYSKENNWWMVQVFSPIRRHITSRLPRPTLYLLSHFLGLVLYFSVKLVYRPLNEWTLGRRFGKFLPYNNYLYYSSRLTYKSLVSIVFDHLMPQLASYISRNEFEDWFLETNLLNVTITSRNNMSWRGLGTCPGKGHKA